MEINWNLTYCGRVYVDDHGIFTFFCNECTIQFGSGSELEQHVRSHLDRKKNEFNLNSRSQTSVTSSWNNSGIKTNNSDDESVTDRLTAPSISSDDDDATSRASIVEDTNHTTVAESSLLFEGDENPIARHKKRNDLETLHCDICQAQVKGKYNMKIHMNNSHMNERDIPTCKICKKKVKYMQRHMLQHETEKRYKCEECDARLTTSTSLKIHKRIHTGERPYVCFKCGLAFVCSAKLTQHMKKHSDEKPFKCEHCGFGFRERYVMRRHVEHVHSGNRPHTCDTCNSTFTSMKALRQHQHLHTEKKFACKFCDLKFAQSSGRRGHEKRVHGAI